MRAFPGTFLATLLGAGIAFAADEVDTPVQAPNVPADVAFPGTVELEIVDCGGVPHYAFAGEAEGYFLGEGLETEADLYEEAVLNAKNRFYGILTEGDSSRRVELSGLFVARHWAEGPMRYVVCMVPVSAVRVSGGGVTEDSPPSQEVTAEKEGLECDEANGTIPASTPTQTIQ